MGGTETYVREMVQALDRRDDVTLTTYVGRPAAGALGARNEVVDPSVAPASSSLSRLTTIGRGLVRGRSAARELARADVVHHAFTVPVPPVRRVPQVRSLADVQHLDLPDLFSRAERIYRSVAYDRAARSADAVVTLSGFSRDRIVERLGIEASRIHVTHLGVVPEDFVSSPDREPFVLYPARPWAHKNHARLVEAMGLVRRQHPDVRLVLTGGGTESLPDLPSWVEARGGVPLAELRSLYSRASCLAFPSLYEGFGLPPLEAMASGCPVAAADAGSIPEVCGDAAVLFDPYDVQAIARGIEEALSSGTRLRELGHQQVRSFTWEGCAEATVAAYRAVTDSPSG